MGAGLRQNLGKEWGPQAWKDVTNTCPNEVFQSVASNSAKLLAKDKKRKANEDNKKSRRQNKYARTDNSAAARMAYSRHDNGITPEEVTADISPDSLEKLKTSFYESKVVVTRDEAELIEFETKTQAESDKWSIERRKRITASKAGGIAKMKETTKRSSKVKSVLYNSFRGNQATRYGTDMEDITMKEYITYQHQRDHLDLTVKKCGLFISENNSWLAATPDGVVHDPSDTDHPYGLLEIKNPFSVRDKSIQEACTTPSTKNSFCLELDKKKETMRLKRRHDYYFQVQCQLYCVSVSWYDFVVRTNKELHVERIYSDSQWWGIQLAKLRKFYFTALLPELACPRHRQGGIREPCTDV